MRWTFLIVLLLLPAWAMADERIVEFAADIVVEPSGQMLVTERITVEARGRNIRRGIYRDFPTRYRDHRGRRVVVPLEVVSVTRNGQPEPWHTQRQLRGERIYFGSPERMLQHGRHTYELTYRTARQVGFFDDFDELYWNVTGLEWDFRIESASARVRIPRGASIGEIRLDAYTGPEGAQGTDFSAERLSGSEVRFETTRPLRSREGLTVVVGFPRGLVVEPTAAERRAWFWDDNRDALYGLIGLLLTLAWYLIAWLMVGRAPPAGAIYPRYQPPADYSPGMLRYVRRMGYDHTCFAAALVSLAVKGAIHLDKVGKTYVASRGDGSTDSPTEKALLDKLTSGGRTLEFRSSNHARVKSVIDAHKKALSRRMEGHYFKLNRIWLVPGIVLSMLAVGSMLIPLSGEERMISMFLTVFAIIWNSAVFAMAASMVRAWTNINSFWAAIAALITSIFMLPFLAGGLAVIGFYGLLVGVIPAVVLAMAIVINIVFWHLMRSPTLRGRKLLDQIEGLRLYLTVAEREEIEQRHADAPPQSFEEFERLLPHAVALDAANTWADRFADIVRQAEISGTAQNRGWYGIGSSSAGAGFDSRSFASGIGSSLASAVRSSASPPGSSSGGGGGGSSGGGGGGGGGGGW
jgi:hypothetical protein